MDNGSALSPAAGQSINKLPPFSVGDASKKMLQQSATIAAMFADAYLTVIRRLRLIRSKGLKVLALPRGIEPLFQP